jgi:hypothetical protein
MAAIGEGDRETSTGDLDHADGMRFSFGRNSALKTSNQIKSGPYFPDWMKAVIQSLKPCAPGILIVLFL